MSIRVFLDDRRSDRGDMLANSHLKLRLAGSDRTSDSLLDGHGRSCAIGQDPAKPGDWA